MVLVRNNRKDHYFTDIGKIAKYKECEGVEIVIIKGSGMVGTKKDVV